MADEYIRKQDAFDAVEARIAELMTHPEFRRKHLDIEFGYRLIGRYQKYICN